MIRLYQNFTMKKLSKFTKISLLTGLIMIAYGYICRIAGLYYFWESKYIGWILILAGLLALFSNILKIRRRNGKRTILEIIGICMVTFLLLLKAIMFIAIPLSDAYPVALDYLKNDQSLITETGAIEGFGFIPTGEIGIPQERLL